MSSFEKLSVPHTSFRVKCEYVLCMYVCVYVLSHSLLMRQYIHTAGQVLFQHLDQACLTV